MGLSVKGNKGRKASGDCQRTRSGARAIRSAGIPSCDETLGPEPSVAAAGRTADYLECFKLHPGLAVLPPFGHRRRI